MSRYETYKPSGIDWIGAIPQQWRIKRLKDLVNPKITDGPHETPELVDDEDSIPFISAEAITENGINYEARGGNISVEQDKIYSLKCKPKRNDIFIVKSGSTTGRIGYVDTDLNFNIWSPLALVRSNSKTSSRFLFHFLSSDCIQRQIQNSWSFGTQPNIGMGVIERLRLALPEYDEQLTIANYLDDQTQEIDRLIANKKAQAEKLKELRQIEINNAVTKGLNRDLWDLPDDHDEIPDKNQGNPSIKKIKVKDSGIEWLGKIPKHWEVKRLKNVANQISEKSSEILDDDFLIALENIESHTGKFIETSSEYENNGIKFKRDNLLYNKLRPYLNKVFLADKDGICVGDIIVIDCTQKLYPAFLQFRMLSDSFCSIIMSSVYGAKMPRTSWQYISSLKIAYPSYEEQVQIVEHLNKRTMAIEGLIQNNNQQIEKLQELRKIKIYEAVTGKVKVSEL